MRPATSALLAATLLQATAVGGCNDVSPSEVGPLTLSVSSKSEPLGGKSVPLEDARFCETGTPNCDWTDADGRAVIELQVGEQTSFTLVADRHMSHLVPFVMPSVVGYSDVQVMSTDDYMVTQFERLTTAYPMRGTGAIIIARFPYAAGATFELKDATGRRFYTDDEGWWSLDLEETTSDGRGGFVEITPGGPYEVVFGGSAEGCTPIWGWPGDARNSFRFPVLENYMTVVSLLCPPS